ncbi:MAG: Phytanoyl-CoA dioxygenase [Fibrobacteres bacterium]|nr:Phytanoyl-CoA dioxygenase [Fibrobacterota bacterium]
MTFRKEWVEEESQKLADELDRDGICILRGLLDPALLREWGSEFEALVDRRRKLPGGLAPRGPGRYYVTLPWVQPFGDPVVFANPGILAVLDRVFAQEYAMVQLAVDTPVLGSDYQEVHRDHRPLFTEEFQTPLYALAVNFPLCEVTEENGPLQMARGTHRMTKEKAMAAIASGENPIESFPMELGDVAIRSPYAMHRGTPNRTDRPRPMVVMGYVMHWLHTAKVDLEVPREAYQSLGERERALLRCKVVERAEADRTESYVEFKY